MTIQNIDFTTVGATGDSGDTDTTAVKPIITGEAVNADNLNRMAENLRVRTELMRQLFNEQRYLNDADRALVMSGGGTVSWGGAGDVDPGSGLGTGIFTTTAPITVRPLMTLGDPQIGYRAGVIVPGPGSDIIELTFTGNAATHAYGSGLGANHIGGNDYDITFVLGPAFGVSLEGSPARHIKVSVVAGTNTTALAAAMEASGVFDGLGLLATPTGTDAINTISDTPGADTLPASPQKLTGAIDGERHVIKSTDVSTFFATPGNELQNGDVVGIYYASMFDGSGGGRTESVPDYGAGAGTDKTGAGAFSLTLFNLRMEPKKLPYAIPVCTVIDDILVFLNQVSVVRGQPQEGLAAGFVQRAGDTMTGALKVAPAAAPASTVSFWVAQPASGITASYKAALIEAKAGVGLEITKTSGTGKSLQISHDGTEAAAYIANTGNNYALSLVQTGATGRALNATAASSAATAYLYNSSTGPALEVRKAATGTAAGVMYVAGPASSKQLLIEPQTAATSAYASLEVWPSQGTTGVGGAIVAYSGGRPAIMGVGQGAAGPGIFVPDFENGTEGLQVVGGLANGVTAGASLFYVRYSDEGTPSTERWLAHFDNSTSGYYPELIGGVLISGTTGGTAAGLKITTSSNQGLGAQILGRTTLTANAASSATRALTITGTAGISGISIVVNTGVPLFINPQFPGDLAAPSMGDLHLVTYAMGTGGTSASRIRGGIKASTWSGTRNSITVSGWNNATPNALYYWVDLEGVCHIRGHLTRDAGAMTFNAGSDTTLSLLIPVNACPLETVYFTAWSTESVGEPIYGEVQTGGDVRFWSTTTGVSTAYLRAISIDYPLW